MDKKYRHLESLAAQKAGRGYNWDDMDGEQKEIIRNSLQFQIWILKLSFARLFRAIIHSLFSDIEQLVTLYWIAVAGLIAITIYALVIGYYFNALFLSGFMLYLAWHDR